MQTLRVVPQKQRSYNTSACMTSQSLSISWQNCLKVFQTRAKHSGTNHSRLWLTVDGDPLVEVFTIW